MIKIGLLYLSLTDCMTQSSSKPVAAFDRRNPLQ